MPGYVLPDYLDGDTLDVQWKLYELCDSACGGPLP